MKDINSNLKLKDKVSVITGGASGIGKEITYLFAQNASDIVVIDINEKVGNEIITDITQKYKVKGLYINCDVSKYIQIKKASENIISRFKKIDNIVCAAGYGPKAPIEDLDIKIWHKTLDINLNGTFYIIYSLLKQILSQKRANIIIIGSATIVTGSGGGVHYAASKAGQYGLMKGLSSELLVKGIRTNIITPHIIDTPLLRSRYPDCPEMNAKLTQRIPLGRVGKPEDIANIALFLASDESEYICGAEIIADGGALYYSK